MAEISEFDGLLIVHAEDAHRIDQAPPPDGASYPAFLRSRPRVAENTAVVEVIELARRSGCRVHILHVSSADIPPRIARARDDRRTHHRGDLPALPDLHRRGHPRRRHAVQVLPPDPRGSQP